MRITHKRAFRNLTEKDKLIQKRGKRPRAGGQLMMPICVESQAPIPPPAYSRAQARSKDALHIDALTLVRTLHLLAVCRLAVRLAHYRCPPPLPAGPGGAPRTYSEASLLLIALLRTRLPPLLPGHA
jgi:hypothetical protein